MQPLGITMGSTYTMDVFKIMPKLLSISNCLLTGAMLTEDSIPGFAFTMAWG